MSKLLNEIIKERKANAISYEEYLRKIAELAKKVSNPTSDDLPEDIKKSNARRVLYNNLDGNEKLSVVMDETIKYIKKADWRGNEAKEREIKKVLYDLLKDIDKVERLFPIIKQQDEY